MPIVRMLVGLVAAYLVGSIPTGYWLVRARKGIDIRQVGSGNIGASNVGRLLGKRWGIGVLIIDILKGTLAVALGERLFYPGSGLLSVDTYGILCGVSAVCGHNWTVFLGFKGGKGVATSAGVLLGLTPLLLLASAVIWGIAAKISGYISAASLAAAVGFCASTFILKSSLEMKIFGVVLALLVIVKHRTNIQRLIAGTEPKIGQAKSARASDAV